MAKKQKRTFLNEKQNKKLIEEILAGNYNSKELSKKYNISYATFCRRVKDIKEGKIKIDKYNSDKIIKEVKEETELSINNTVVKPKLIPYYRSRIVKVGLIKDRHLMPCDDFIFDYVPTEKMFDFNYLDSVVSEFILHKIGIQTVGNVNYANRDLYVYVTGLQSALGSLMKMCKIYNVSLTLLHYNKDTNKYEPQVISKDKFEDTKDCFYNITGDIYFTDDCPDIDTVRKSKFIFVLKEIHNKRENGKLNLISNNTFLYKTENLAWEEYLKMCKNASISNDEISIYLECGRLDIDDKYTKIRVMNRVYNFEAPAKNNTQLTTLRNTNNSINKIIIQKEDLYI